MKVSFFALLIGAVILAAGCGKPEDGAPAGGDTQATTGGSGTTGSKTATEATTGGRTLVGSWNQVGDEASTSIAEFKEDGTFSLVQADRNNPAKAVRIKGTYKVEGDKVIRTFTEVETEGTNQAETAQLKKGFETFKDKPQPGLLVWVSDNEVKFTDDASSVTTIWRRS